MIGTLLLAAICNCAVCPERENDFVWENDKFGMRAYGPGEYHRWSGFDVFNKGKGAGSVVEMMHKPGACGNWHETPWKGVIDNYTMGASRGVGGIAMFADGEWKTFPDWETSRVIHTGDDYLEFELVYPAFSAAGKMTCHITLKRGERFFRNDVSFQHMPEGFVVGPGLDLEPKRDHKGVLFEDAKAGVVSLFEDPKGANGSTMSVIFAAPGQKFELMTDHMNCRVIGFRSRTFTYYAGASWSNAGEITTAEAWRKTVDAAACRVRKEDGHLVVPVEATPATYLKSLAAFLRYLPETVRACPDDPTLMYYGPGGAGHWAVQMNQQVAAALAILSETPDAELKAAGSPYAAAELRDLALKLTRYSLRTHVTGDRTCTDGAKWGKTWISVLGLERSSGGFNILEKHMTDDDRARLKKVLVSESDYRLKEYPIKAGLTRDNVPESNLWNAGVMIRTALNYPDLPQATNYLAKARKMTLNGLTTPADAGEDWYVGPNFTRNWSLDHHGYLNVGYMYECFSNIAFLYFNCLDRGQTLPPEAMNHVQDLWAVCKRLTFPDGRLCRIGGDTRSRYSYCQVFAMQAWMLMAHAFGDEDAVRFERAYLAKMLHEQRANGDGSYFGKRLGNVRDASWYYYCRLEADAVLTLAFNLHWRRTRTFPAAKGEVEVKGEETWSDDYHRANFIRGPKSFRSAVFRAQGGFGQRGQMPNVVCVPTAKSDLAEWSANLVGVVGLQMENDDWTGLPNEWPKGCVKERSYRDAGGSAFEQSFTCPIREGAPYGEGELANLVCGERTMKIVAIGDGATMAIRDCVKITRDVSLEHGFSTAHLMIPNDLFNGGSRRYAGLGYETTLEGAAVRNETIDTRSRILTVDDALSLISASGKSVKIRRFVQPSVTFELPGERRFLHPLSSLRADELCLSLAERPVRAHAGETLYDETYLVAAGVDAEAAQKLAASVRWDEGTKRLSFRGVDGLERMLDMGSAIAQATPETSWLFEKRVDPVSGVVSYALSGGERGNCQSIYFTAKSMTDDGRFLVFDKSVNERFDAEGSPTWGKKRKAVVDFAKDAIFDLPGANGRIPFIDAKEDYLVTADDRGFVKYDLREPSKPIRLCDFPEDLLKLGKTGWFTHLTLTPDRKKAFLDACVQSSVATNYVQGLLELATGRFEKWGQTDFYCNHGQLNPVRDDLALCAWEEVWTGTGAKRWKELGYCPRLWLMEPGGRQTMVRPVGNVNTTHEIWDDDGRGFSWCRPGVCHHDLATGRNEVWCPDERAIHARITRDGRYIVYDRYDRKWWRGCRWAVSFYDRETKRTVDVYSVRPPLNPRERQSALHPDPHPQFVCNDRYVVSTACNAEGNMELFVTPVDQLKRATAATADRLLADWPANRDPRTVNRIVTEQFLRADALAYKPVGTDIAKHFKVGYGWGNSVFYATVSLWVTALENARKFGDRDLEAELLAKFEPVLAKAETVMRPQYHVDYNVVGALPLAVARLTGDEKAKEIGLGLADFQWSEPRKAAPVINGNPEHDEAMRLWKAGYTGETRLWIDDMYMINLLQTQAYRLTGDRKYVDRAAKEMCLYLEKLQLENGLFYHAPDVPFVWGRGAGWMAAGMPLVLMCLKSDHPHYAQILAGYRKMMAALLRYQRADGLWGQLVDDPTTWAETSGSAMFAYGLAEGVKNGWLDRKTCAPAVRRAYLALCDRMDEYGNVSDVCIGTNKKNDRAYYLARERINGDPHGQAPMLWLAGALSGL